MAGKLCLSTHLDVVLSNRPYDVTKLQPCNHSEADTRIVLHLVHAADQGHRKAFARTVDSDIVVLAVGFFARIGLAELWVGCGSGKTYRDVPIHKICSDLGPSKYLALPLFPSLTGCDTTSQFLGCGKKTAWAAWSSSPGHRETLLTLMENPETFTKDSVHMHR